MVCTGCLDGVVGIYPCGICWGKSKQKEKERSLFFLFLFEDDFGLVEEEAVADGAVDLFGEVLGLEFVPAAGADDDGLHGSTEGFSVVYSHDGKMMEEWVRVSCVYPCF
jgi:hypothetical protein